MLKNVVVNRTLFLITGVLALAAAVVGVLIPRIYDPVVTARIIPGIFTQDLLVILASLVIILLAISMKQHEYRKTIVIYGGLGFLFYAYGIYAIEQVYTALYPLYLAILGLSFYTLAYSLSNCQQSEIEALVLPGFVRYGSAAYGIFIAVMFNFIWFSQLVPLLKTGERIEYTFSVYIIDLVFIMPAFVITGLLAIQNRALGLVGLPALFVVGLGILSPLALAEILKPSRYGMPVEPGEFWLYGILSMVFLLFTVIFLVTLRPNCLPTGPGARLRRESGACGAANFRHISPAR